MLLSARSTCWSFSVFRLVVWATGLTMVDFLMLPVRLYGRWWLPNCVRRLCCATLSFVLQFSIVLTVRVDAIWKVGVLTVMVSLTLRRQLVALGGQGRCVLLCMMVSVDPAKQKGVLWLILVFYPCGTGGTAVFYVEDVAYGEYGASVLYR